MDLSGLERLHLFQKCCSFGGKWDSWIYHHVCKKSVDVTWAREIQGLSPLLTGSFLGVYQHVWSYEQHAILLGPFLSKKRRFGDLTPGIFHFFFCLGIFLLFLKKFLNILCSIQDTQIVDHQWDFIIMIWIILGDIWYILFHSTYLCFWCSDYQGDSCVLLVSSLWSLIVAVF